MTRGVLVLTPYFAPVMGGVESNAERLAAYLGARGVPVTVLTKRIDAALPDEEERSGFRVRRIGPIGGRTSLGKWRLVPAACLWLIRHAHEYDVVCCVDFRATGLAALVARRVTGRPVVFQAQTTGVVSGENTETALRLVGIDPAGRVAGRIRRLVRGIYGRADAIACISHEIEREAIAAGVPAERVYYFPNAIDMSRFRPPGPGERDRLRARLDVGREAVVCLFVGRLSREKGLLDLLEAWRLLMADPSPSGRAPALLLVAGPDMTGHPWDVGPAGRAFVERHGLGGSVRFLGPVSDAAPLVRAADIVVQPSHFEALGLSAIEALASGVPVVASAVGGLLEFIRDGRNGRLCPPQDPARLAACLRSLIDDPAARQRLAAEARASVCGDYDEGVVFGRMQELFERLAGARRS